MDAAITTGHEQQRLRRNLLALRAAQPGLAQRLAGLAEQEIIPLEPGAGGALTARRRGDDGQEVRLASRHDPVAEARRWVDSLEDLGPEVHTVVVSGMALGYHVAELLARRRGGLVVVLEPSIPMLQAALRCQDFAAHLMVRRLVLVAASRRDELFEPLCRHNVELMLGTRLAQHQVSGRLQGAACAELQRAFTDYLQYVRSALVTSLHISETTCRNVLHGLPYYLGWPGVEDLTGAWAGRPAFCVSAGPSLRKNMHLLRLVKGRGPIIAVQTVLKTLLSAGIRPDYVTALDYSMQSQRFYEDLPAVPDVTLVAEPKVNAVVPDHWPGAVRMLHNHFAARILRELDDAHAALPAGATVAHLSFYLARHLGCGPIVLLGQDLGFDGNVYYSPGVPIQRAWSAELNRFNTMEMMEWQRIARMHGVLRKVPDILGREIYTDAQMFTYLQQFERDIAATTVPVIDATEGGARIAGTEVLPLAEAIERHCPPAPAPVPPLPRRHEDAPARYARAVESMRHRLEELDRLEEVCVKVLEPLRQMTDALDDVGRFNRLHARMDRWRVKIDELTEIYHLVSDVVQLAELKRVQMDKALDRKEQDEVAVRRDQLARDIQYVSLIQEGARGLRRLLGEAIERLEEARP